MDHTNFWPDRPALASYFYSFWNQIYLIN